MENRFDLFTKIFAGEGSRRDMIRRFGGLIAGASVVSAAACERSPTSPQAAGPSPGEPLFQFGDAPGRCRRNGHRCRENAECCSNYCDPTTARCTCGPFSELCPQTDICVPACRPPRVFNSQTCKCECPTGFETCGDPSFQGEFCCASQFTRCCDHPSGFDACCPNTYSCCFGSFFTTCCPPDYRCCTSPTGDANCCPPGFTCCVHREFGFVYCGTGPDPCPF
jgi:hypothetical protein